MAYILDYLSAFLLYLIIGIVFRISIFYNLYYHSIYYNLYHPHLAEIINRTSRIEHHRKKSLNIKSNI